jgi:hypothetical protein
MLKTCGISNVAENNTIAVKFDSSFKKLKRKYIRKL